MHNGMQKNGNKNGSCLCVVLDSDDDDDDEKQDNSLSHDEMTMIYRNH